MTTVTGAFDAIRSRLESGTYTDGAGNTLTSWLRFQGEDADDLPNTPAPFAYIELENFGAGRGPVAFGGGIGNNLYRNEGLINAFVFVPNGQGLRVAVAQAEQIAARMRSFRDGDISCFSASVHPIGEGTSFAPKGLNSEVNNYTCAVVEIAFHFDQIG
jgi:hypothetical protein